MSSRTQKIMQMASNENVASTDLNKPSQQLNMSLSNENTATSNNIEESLPASDASLIQYAMNVENQLQHALITPSHSFDSNVMSSTIIFGNVQEDINKNNIDEECDDVADPNEQLKDPDWTEPKDQLYAIANKSDSNLEQFEDETDIGIRPKTMNKSSIKNAENMDDPDTAIKDAPRKARKKKRHVNKEEWEVNVQKIKRSKGQEYNGLNREGGKWTFNKKRNARQLKPSCLCKQSRQKSKLNCNLLTEKDRQVIFQNFWSKSWTEKKEYVRSLVDLGPVKQRKTEAQESRRKNSLYFFLKVARGARFRVCKTQFLNTLCIGEWSVLSWVKSSKGNPDQEVEELTNEVNKEANDVVERTNYLTVKPTNANEYIKSNLKRNHVKKIEMNYLRDFLNSLPNLESHYCRATSSKKYLEPIWTSKNQIYRFYKEECSRVGIDAVSDASFSHVFSDLNYSLFRPKKDQCDTCIGFKIGNIDEIVFNAHLKRKDAARNTKNQDKEEKKWVFTMDLQSVLMAPLTKASAMYYKSKLVVHNFTIFNLKNLDGHCYLWHEGQGGLTANEFASILHSFIFDLHTEDGDEVTFYSDGCTYQNRNAIISNTLLFCSMKKKITIIQNYLEKGHTQMECDSMHSVIERKLRNTDIYTPAGYVSICKSARNKPRPYYVNYLSFDFFKKMSDFSFYSTIRPGFKKGDPMVTDISCLKYNPSGIIEYKLNYSDEWIVLPKRRKDKECSVNINIPNLYKEPLKIDKKKFDNLQKLKGVIEHDYHFFYDQLPHKDT